MKTWQYWLVSIAVFSGVASVISLINDAAANQPQQAPEQIEIHRYYNKDSQVECFYHQNAISCLWVMDGEK